ncbi:S-methyl-5'-thioadenosine phosphorylase [Amblyraja radiata]|uniref:S-methyl-5'-thioadenosine phosphorylase n=1 Tax=Amblyraja radiata TaxID=386614 RepID=UPI00140213DB|nr:S-methyl-5'-thioadenosine phosphorylase [Amblyraja radiata]
MVAMQRIAVTLESVIKTAHFRSIFRKERLFQVTSVEVLLTSNYNCNVSGHLNVQRVPKKHWTIDVCRSWPSNKLQELTASIGGLDRKVNVPSQQPEAQPCGINMASVKIGIIGGSGLGDMDILEEKCEKHVDTPFGKPSDVLVVGKIKNINCVLLARHGRGHSIMPTNVNYQANIWALKNEGCTHIIAATACGSLQEDIQPGDIVIIDQFIDRTTKRHQTFYGGSPTNPVGVCHISMADPFCKRSREVLIDVVKKLGIKHHTKGTMVTIEGPRFSSRAESLMFRQWGGDVINMTTVPEVVLAKEAGISYVSIAMATDYDCWKESGDVVTVEMVLKVMKENANTALKIILAAVAQIASMDWQESIKNLKASQEASVMLPTH